MNTPPNHTATAGSRRTAPGAASSRTPGYAPVPPSALGPALNADGYFAGSIDDTLHWVTESFYQAMFLTTPEGVVLVDAPPTIGRNLLRAIDSVTTANGMPSTVTHMVYSHSHADHIGASSLFGPDVIRIGHAENLRLLCDDDPNRPPPTVTFEDRYVLEVGGERLELAYHGPNSAPDNIFIYAPAPPDPDGGRRDLPRLGAIQEPGPRPGHPRVDRCPAGGHELSVDNAGRRHLGRLGTRADGHTQIQYMADLQASTQAAIAFVDPTPYFQQYSPNAWAIFKAYLDEVSTRAAGPVTAKYTGVLAAADVYSRLNAAAMLDSLRVDTGDLGPFSGHP